MSKQDGPWNSDNIKSSRKTNNWTQAELAEKLGCRQQTVSEWEIGLYAPKNAYQKLLSMVFQPTSQERPSV